MIWFTADEHFGHDNKHGGIVSMQSRPFRDIHEHDEKLIGYHNEVVDNNDAVYHLGDFCYRCSEYYARSVLERLNGKHYLVKGGHDKISVRLPFEWAKDLFYLQYDPRIAVVMCHYAMRTWPQSHRGSIHCYGHSHGKLSPYGLSFDVGVDCWDYRPINIEQVVEKANKLKKKMSS